MAHSEYEVARYSRDLLDTDILQADVAAEERGITVAQLLSDVDVFEELGLDLDADDIDTDLSANPHAALRHPGPHLCPICAGALGRLRLHGTKDMRPLKRVGAAIGGGHSDVDAFRCGVCGWWALRHSWEDATPFGFAMHEEWAVCRLYRVPHQTADVPLGALRDFLQAHPDHLAHIDSRAFEVLMAECLRDWDPSAIVEHVGGTGDGGVDILITNGSQGPTVVQVKRRVNGVKPEGIEVVRSLHGVLLREGFTRGMVISTAPRFTAGAQSEAEQVRRRVLRYEMRLLSRQDVIDLLNLPEVMDRPPWQTYGPGIPRRPSYRYYWIPSEL